ncbi:hypothetical protein ABFS82_11G118700 [Erythranthe guttata]|uniref:myb-like protein X n=1 Tax=Erythranthe guttata TaxID=4155 RepID=UPI00064DE1E8|nr:PREDICTED: myb-like protein X [Erythranthe guttata]|eukprot:XP_012840583.1 PREDICTED: myb-like protein X [Erythranthe guttata]
MEQENVKGKNNNQDGVPLLEGKNSVDDASSSSSSPSTSSIQDHNSSEKPQLVTDDENEKNTNTPLASENANSEAMMKSPPAQMMGGPLPEPPGYDPNRIPASVFAKSNTAGEWSVASNESLFSIHMGNNSFSRDYAILFGKSGEFPRPEDWPGPQSNPFGKSGELPRLEDWNNNNINNNDQVVMINNNSLPPVMEVPAHEENSMQSGELSRSDKKEEEEKSPTVENHEKPTVPTVSPEVAKKEPIAESPKTSSPSNTLPPYSSPPRFSSGSGHSGSSFAFPVLVSESGKTAGSLKVVPEKEEVLLPEGKEEVSKENIPADAGATETKSWFPCFACWPRCC